jgi:hypothetical protein
MRSPEVDPKLRIDAAKAAAQFIHAKPGSKPGDQPKLIESPGWSAEDQNWLDYLRRHRNQAPEPDHERRLAAFERFWRIAHDVPTTDDLADDPAAAWFGIERAAPLYTRDNDPLLTGRAPSKLSRDD